MSPTADATQPSTPVTPDDIEGKLRELQGDVDELAEDARSYAITVGAVVVVGLVVVAFWLGRRKGRKSAAVIEIRRA